MCDNYQPFLSEKIHEPFCHINENEVLPLELTIDETERDKA
jgi:hypothetical protein